MLHLKQLFSPFSLFVLCVVFLFWQYLSWYTCLSSISKVYIAWSFRSWELVFTSLNSFNHKVPWKNLILKTSRELVFIAKYDNWKNRVWTVKKRTRLLHLSQWKLSLFQNANKTKRFKLFAQVTKNWTKNISSTDS